MSSDASALSLPAPRIAAKRFFGAPLRKQTYLNLIYLALAFPLGLVYFVFVTAGVSTAAALSVTLVGIPLFVALLAVSSKLAAFERLLARKLLDVDVPPQPGRVPVDDASPAPSLWARARDAAVALVTDLGVWKGLVYLASKFFLGVGALVAITVSATLGGTMLLTPTFYRHANVYVGFRFAGPATITPQLELLFDDFLIGATYPIELASWQVTTLPQALAVAAAGAFVLLASLHLLNGLAWVYGKYVELMLSPTSLSQRVREFASA
jgi:hypothetical protein